MASPQPRPLRRLRKLPGPKDPLDELEPAAPHCGGVEVVVLTMPEISEASESDLSDRHDPATSPGFAKLLAAELNLPLGACDPSDRHQAGVSDRMMVAADIMREEGPC